MNPALNRFVFTLLSKTPRNVQAAKEAARVELLTEEERAAETAARGAAELENSRRMLVLLEASFKFEPVRRRQPINGHVMSVCHGTTPKHKRDSIYLILIYYVKRFSGRGSFCNRRGRAVPQHLGLVFSFTWRDCSTRQVCMEFVEQCLVDVSAVRGIPRLQEKAEWGEYSLEGKPSATLQD